MDGYSDDEVAPVSRLPNNSTVNFPIELFVKPLLKKQFLEMKQELEDSTHSGAGAPGMVVVACPDHHHDRIWSCPKPDCQETPCTGEPAVFVKHLTSHGDYEGLNIMLCTITFQTSTEELKTRRKLYTIGPKPRPVAKKKRSYSKANQQQKIAELEEQNATLKQAHASSTASREGLQGLLKDTISMMAEKDRTHADENSRMLAIQEKLANSVASIAGNIAGNSFSSIQQTASKYNKWEAKKRAPGG